MNTASLDYILNKFNLSFDTNAPMPIEIPDFGRDQLPQLLHELDFKTGVEVGVAEGIYSKILAEANPQMKLYGVDCYVPYEGYRWYTRQTSLDSLYIKVRRRLGPFENYELIKAFSMDAVKRFEDNSLDFVYLDANHEDPFVTQDITQWHKKIKPGGILAGHDYVRTKTIDGQPLGNDVIQAVQTYTKNHDIEPWFVLGLYAKIPGMIRDANRSWMWVKMTSGSMLGKWDGWYKNIKSQGSFRYGNTVTYQLAADFLADVAEVEDWGCGTGGFKRLYNGKYIGVDGSANPFVDKVADLCTYRSSVDGIVMRHVLEHNYDWADVLAGAVSSFRKKFCLVLFTPFMDTTGEIAHNKKHGVDVPDIAFNKKDIERFFEGLKWRLQDNIKTRTGYGVEHVYFVEK